MTSPTRIVVVDDHHLFRAGVVELLQSVPGFEIVADGANGVEAIVLAREMRPNVVLLDVEMPGPGVVTTIREIIAASPHTRIVVLTMHDDADLLRDLVDSGASGYLLKSAGRSELVAAINAASRADGGMLISVSKATFATLAHPASNSAPLLSARELEVLALLAGGKSNQQIASALHISAGTVKRHVANIYNKLDTSSRLEAIRKAIQLGLMANTFSEIQPDRTP